MSVIPPLPMLALSLVFGGACAHRRGARHVARGRRGACLAWPRLHDPARDTTGIRRVGVAHGAPPGEHGGAVLDARTRGRHPHCGDHAWRTPRPPRTRGWRARDCWGAVEFGARELGHRRSATNRTNNRHAAEPCVWSSRSSASASSWFVASVGALPTVARLMLQDLFRKSTFNT